VLLADDHPLFLDGLRLLLETAGLSVAGVASDGAQLVELAKNHQADVAVVDLDMPGMDGLTAIESLMQVQPQLAVLVLTMHDEAALVRRALDAGARGYVLKGAGHGAVVRAVQAVAEGDTVLSGGVGRAVLEGGTGSDVPFPDLTERERQVLELMAGGLGNAAIAQRMHLSVKTVQNHVSNVFGKLGVSSRAEAVARARDHGVAQSGRSHQM
jgi:DNA-binding NarL/FixJ family response regulator